MTAQSPVVVDSTVWIDFFNGVPAPHVSTLVALMRSEIPMAVPDVVAMEILQGVRSDVEFDAVEAALSDFDRVDVGGWDACLAAAHRYRRMRAAGFTPRKSIDVLIASWCIDHGAWLLHHDRDFEPLTRVLGLRTVGAAPASTA